jgi:cytochrome c5
MHYKNSLVISAMAIIVTALSAASLPAEDEKFKNLKVLPKNISKDELKEVMDGFKVSLGVKCNHCHAPSKSDPKKLDFVSDELPEKETARAMMRMTSQLNKKYFGHEKDGNGNPVLKVSCFTCHNGKTEPVSQIPPQPKP